MARKGLGKGLDVLIPDFYDEDFDSNSPQSLEDLLNEEDNTNDVEDPKTYIAMKVLEKGYKHYKKSKSKKNM